MPPVLKNTTVILIGIAATTFVSTGCESESPIITYEIPITVPAAFAAEDTRMVAAILPQDKQAWFFKLSGRKSAVDSVAESFRKFVENVPFEEGVPVLDDLPDGWRTGGKKAMRFATIDINTPTEQLDLSVSQLARMSDWDELIVMNVNRWRGQVGLGDSEAKWADAQPLDHDASTPDAPAIWVDVTGRPEPAADPMASMRAGGRFASGSAPFAGQSDSGPAADPHAGLPREAREAIASGKMKAPGPVSDKTASEPKSDSDSTSKDSEMASKEPESKLEYDQPEDWRDGRMTVMRMAAFNTGPDDAAAEITVMTAGGDLRGNVARWMGQVNESAVPEEEIDAALENAEKLDVGGRPAQRFVILPKTGQTAIDGTIVPLEEGFSLFIKMTGPVDVVTDQNDAMKSFLESLRY